RAGLRPDECVETGGRCLAVDRDDFLAGPSPRDSEPVECGGEQADDVLRHIREVVADAHHAPVIGDDATAVAVDETEDELFGFLVDERLLPWLEDIAPLVLPTGSVLREQARPVLGVHPNFDAAHPVYDSGALTGHQRVDRTATAIDDCRVFLSRVILRCQTRLEREMYPSPR